ncbi:3-dehydroquinate synthase [Enterococcus saigonensis]|uniref:3-dehydroquinate synthase n=1 Tax=Enterococcus saigonensis TaxID=1805431 RepID=A0A679ILW9_9ENTE|nr:3-dehydroquinate synthase [Enterococcus saigonensis]BCA85731.1 3-dehydroquinate synthase [Enterococcus saigonensis]
MRVNLKEHSYEIIIKRGALEQLGTWVSSLWMPQKIAVITDSNVAPLYSEIVMKQLTAAGFAPHLAVVPAGETSKSLKQAARLYDFLAEAGFTRSDGIVALGGGVVGDLAGFVASTFMRGIHFLQIPTTLLAQVDSSIGGKTGVNTQKAKNLVGTFNQPSGVLIDPDVLKTLEIRRVREGIAEIIKSAAIADLVLWNKLTDLKDEADLLKQAEEIITAALEIKRHVVQEDEFDNGMRLILNFGHTIGHAIENTAGYGVVSHGEGVALGMIKINHIAEAKGLSPLGSTKQLQLMIEKFHLPTNLPNWDETALYSAITHDKKARGTTLKIILLEQIGKAKIVEIPLIEMKDYLKEAL